MVRQPGRAKDPVAFAAKIFRREPALVPRRPEPDEFAHGIEIGESPKNWPGFSSFTGRLKPVATGVNEHQIAVGQDRILVVHQPERRRAAACRPRSSSRGAAERAEMQPHGRRAGTAVETKT